MITSSHCVSVWLCVDVLTMRDTVMPAVMGPGIDDEH